MKIKVNIWALIVFILLVCSDLSWKRPIPIITVLFILYILINKKYYKGMFESVSKLIYIVAIAAGIGFFMLFLGNVEVKKYLADIYTMTSSAIIIVFGFLLYNSKYISKNNLLKAIVYAGLYVAIHHIFLVAIGAQSTGATDDEISLRGVGGNSTNVGVFSLVILLFAKDEDGRYLYGNVTRIIFSAILLISILMYFSRTNISTLAIAIVVMTILFNGKKKISLNKIVKGLCILACGALLLTLGIKAMPATARNRFLEKFENSYDEAFVGNKNSKWTFNEMTRNWRAYEVYRVQKTMKQANTFNKFFGYGAGKKISLGVTINLGGKDYSEIAVIHNGYYYVMLKAGYIGVLLYVLYLAKYILYGRKYIYNDADCIEARLLILAACYALFTTYFVAGFYNQGGLFICSLIIGYMYEYLKKRRNLNKQDIYLQKEK